MHEEIALYITFLISDTGLEVSGLHGKPQSDMKSQNSLHQKEPSPFLGAFANLRKATISFRHVSPSFVLSVRLSVHMEQLIPN